MKKITFFKFFVIAALAAISEMTFSQASIGVGGTYTQNFDDIGITATASLPDGWKVDQGTSYSTGTTATTVAYGTAGTGVVTNASAGGAVNWANGETGTATDRSVGFLASSSYTFNRNLYLQLQNNTGSTVTDLTIGYEVEKYRTGNKTFAMDLYTSTDGTNWTKVSNVSISNAADANSTTVSNPPTTTSKSTFISGLSIADGANLYLRWEFRSQSTTISQGYGLDNISVSKVTHVNYYSKPTGNLDEVATWGTSTDGSGTQPTNFTDNNQAFNIVNNAAPTIGAAWTVSGENSKVVVGNGTDATTFTISAEFSTNALIEVRNNATLKLVNTTLPTFGYLAPGSTVEYAQTSNVSIADATYSNLIISGGTTRGWTTGSGRIFTGNLTVSGNSTVNFTNGQAVNIAGNFQVDEGSTFNFGGVTNRIIASGLNRTVTVNGTVSISTNETQKVEATSPFQYSLNGFTTYTFGSNSWVQFKPNHTASVTQGIDGITGSPFANVEIVQANTFNHTFTVKSDLNISGNLAFPRTAAGTMTVNFGAYTVKVGGAIQLSGKTTNSETAGRTYNAGTSTVEFNGTLAQSIGGTDLPAAYNNLVINNAAGVTLSENTTVGGNITINAGSALTLASTKSLGVTGNFTINSNSLGKTGTFVDNGTTTFGSTTTANQYLGTARNWYMSSPVSGASALPAVSSGSRDFYSYPENDANQLISGTSPFVWSAGNYWITPVETSFTAAKGYIVKPSETSTLSFTGTSFNSGEKTIGLTYTTANPKKGFNLVGNPYPAYLNILKAFDTDNDGDIDGSDVDNNIMPTYWIKTQTPANAYIWDTYNLPSEIVANGSTLPLTKFISPMQAFWMRAKTSTGATLTLNSSMCTHQDVSNNKFRARSSSNLNSHIVRLRVSNSTNYDEAVLYVNENASNELDNYDSPKMLNGNAAIPEIYTTLGTEKLVINGMKTLPLNKEIGLGFIPGSATSFSITANEISNLPSDVKVILKDNATQAEMDLTDGVTAYEFSPATTSGDRFSLLFRAPSTTTGVNDSQKLNAQVFVNKANQLTIVAPINSKYVVFNALGQKLMEDNTQTNQTTTQLRLLKGVYVVKVSDSVNKLTTKIIIN